MDLWEQPAPGRTVPVAAEAQAWAQDGALPKVPREDHRRFARTAPRSEPPIPLQPGAGIYARMVSLKFIIATFGAAESAQAFEKLLERFRQRARESEVFSGARVVELQLGGVQKVPG